MAVYKSGGEAVPLSQCSISTSQRFTFYDQCHTTGSVNTSLAAFLIGAGEDHYIATGGWHQAGPAPISNRPAILDFPLGAPTGDATYDAATTTWHRSFASGTKVTFNASNGFCPNRRQKICPGTSISWG